MKDFTNTMMTHTAICMRCSLQEIKLLCPPACLMSYLPLMTLLHALKIYLTYNHTNKLDYVKLSLSWRKFAVAISLSLARTSHRQKSHLPVVVFTVPVEKGNNNRNHGYFDLRVENANF